jgi:UDP-glucuronate 4-epimerase
MIDNTFVLVTGAAGFIGFHLSLKLTSLGYSVVGIDNLNDYYDVKLKYARTLTLNRSIFRISKDLIMLSENTK